MAIDFDGSSLYDAATAPDTAESLTISCWFNTDSLTAARDLVRIYDTGSVIEHYLLWTDGARIKATASSGVIPRTVTTTADHAVSTWNHACGAFISTTSRAVYLNGGSKGSATNLSSTSIATGAMRIGDVFDGRLAEVAIWNATISDAEVLVLSKGFSPLCIKPHLLVFYAPFIRDPIDIWRGLTLTPTGSPTAAPHTRIIYPHKRVLGLFGANQYPRMDLSLSGTGVLEASTRVRKGCSISLTGTGFLEGSTRVGMRCSTSLSGTGSFESAITAAKRSTADLGGEASLDACLSNTAAVEYPATRDVREGTHYGNPDMVGILRLPTECQVEAGVEFGAQE